MIDDLNEVKNKIKHTVQIINGRYCRWEKGASSIEVWNGDTWEWMTHDQAKTLPKKKKIA